MPQIPLSLPVFPVFFVFATAAVLSTGCSERPSAPDASEGPAPPSADAEVYHVRGVVAQVPRGDGGPSEFQVRHEEIPDFKDQDGQEVGMPIMTMPFPVARGLDISELQVGDKVEVTFVVEWNADDPWQATAVQTLPADTELSLGEGPTDDGASP
ncbi:MAG: copper-binding protein [Planctomycetota bacterium]